VIRYTLAILIVMATTPLACAEGSVSSPAERPVDAGKLTRLARRAEPDLVGRPERLQQYIDVYRTTQNDTRLFAFNVTAKAKEGGAVVLRGYVEYAEPRHGVAEFLRALGFQQIQNEIELLPAASLGSKRFGVVSKPHALSYDNPRHTEVVTDLLEGEPLFLLREEDGHFLVHGGDGYLGYVAAADVRRIDEAEFVRHVSKSERDAPTSTNENVETAIGHARSLLGTKYLWGGRTGEGVDCSGLVQTSFAKAGIRIPRDADQQSTVGRLVGTRWFTAAMRRGDTLYFIDPMGHVSHTGIYLGDGQYVHSCSPTVTINSFNPKHDNYHAARAAGFAFARRVWE
jgi:cell wall-associated NlpC family hydrolase